jgi:hypothetical protein
MYAGARCFTALDLQLRSYNDKSDAYRTDVSAVRHIVPEHLY